MSKKNYKSLIQITKIIITKLRYIYLFNNKIKTKICLNNYYDYCYYYY